MVSAVWLQNQAPQFWAAHCKQPMPQESEKVEVHENELWLSHFLHQTTFVAFLTSGGGGARRVCTSWVNNQRPVLQRSPWTPSQSLESANYWKLHHDNNPTHTIFTVTTYLAWIRGCNLASATVRPLSEPGRLSYFLSWKTALKATISLTFPQSNRLSDSTSKRLRQLIARKPPLCGKRAGSSVSTPMCNNWVNQFFYQTQFH